MLSTCQIVLQKIKMGSKCLSRTSAVLVSRSHIRSLFLFTAKTTLNNDPCRCYGQVPPKFHLRFQFAIRICISRFIFLISRFAERRFVQHLLQFAIFLNFPSLLSHMPYGAGPRPPQINRIALLSQITPMTCSCSAKKDTLVRSTSSANILMSQRIHSHIIRSPSLTLPQLMMMDHRWGAMIFSDAGGKKHVQKLWNDDSKLFIRFSTVFVGGRK